MTEIVAIDGPASVGKSSLAKKLADKFKCPVLDSGRLYRSVALEMLINNIKQDNKKGILNCVNKIDSNLKSKNIFSNEVSRLSAKISTKKYLRESLKQYQLDFPKKYAKGNRLVICVGRDIATVIFPKAKYKIFLFADARVRAERRYLQIKKNGKSVSFKSVLKEINNRDKMDLNRKIAPLRPAVNSYFIDTSKINITQALNMVNKLILK